MGALARCSIGFIEPINMHMSAGRATKYGLRFVVLTFVAFFIFEILQRRSIHPVRSTNNAVGKPEARASAPDA